MKRSRRYNQAAKTVDTDKTYTLDEAIEMLKSMPKVKFDESVEICGKLGADPKQSDQMVRGSVMLPFGTGKKVRVLVFCEPDKEAEAKSAGAEYVGSQDLADKILNEGWTEFDCCVSTPSMMRVVSRLGKFLGPRGLMPSPKTGTVTDNIAYAVEEAKKGKIDFRMDKLGGIHIAVGKISFAENELRGNIKAFVEALVASRPSSVKGDFIKELYISTTMSPSVRVSL